MKDVSVWMAQIIGVHMSCMMNLKKTWKKFKVVINFNFFVVLETCDG